MSTAFDFLTSGPWGLFALNIVLVVSSLSALGLYAVRLSRGRPAPWRHGVLLTTLLLVLASPLLTTLAIETGLAQLILPTTLLGTDAETTLTPVASNSLSADGEVVAAEFSPEPQKRLYYKRLGRQTFLGLGLLLLVIWVTGMAWQAARLLQGILMIYGLRRSLRPADSRWIELAQQAAQAVGLRQPLRVALSDLLQVPVSMGVSNPVVVIPAYLQDKLSDAEAEAILLHESAHVAQGDLLTGVLQRLGGILFWWHPLARGLSRELDEVKEELCDNHVVRVQGHGKTLARCLVKLAEWIVLAREPRRELPLAVGLLGGNRSSGLERRVKDLLNKERNTMTRMNRMMTLALMAFALLAAGVGAIGTLRAAPAPAKDTAPSEKELDKRIDQLQSEDAKEREKISAELVKLGKSALPALKAALKRNDDAFRSRVEKVIAKIEGPMPAVGAQTTVAPANIQFQIQLAPGGNIVPGQGYSNPDCDSRWSRAGPGCETCSRQGHSDSGCPSPGESRCSDASTGCGDSDSD